MPPTQPAPIGWRPTPEQREWLEGRAERAMRPEGLSARTRIELQLWQTALRAELARLRWTLSELGMIADICNGTVVPDALGRLVAAEVGDAIGADPGIWGDKWGTDEDALLARLLQLGPTADHALMDAVAAWWATRADHTVDGWASVGVRVVES